MTDESRETLRAKINEWRDYAPDIDDQGHHTRAEAICDFAIELEEVLSAAALRDVLTPRTCSTCRHAKFYTTNSEYGMCRGDSIAIGRDITGSDGCIKGWQAREGEGGGHV